jgi:hypothetical protein
MKIKKVRAKEFHSGNRLNGNGADLTATYGVFDDAKQIGFLLRIAGTWQAYDLEIGKPMLARRYESLNKIKEALSNV